MREVVEMHSSQTSTRSPVPLATYFAGRLAEGRPIAWPPHPSVRGDEQIAADLIRYLKWTESGWDDAHALVGTLPWVRRAASELAWRLRDEVRLDGAEIERIYADAALAPD